MSTVLVTGGSGTLGRVATEDVAVRVAEVLTGEPLRRADDFGGPEVLTLAELARAWQARRGRPGRVVRIGLPAGSPAPSARAPIPAPITPTAPRPGRSIWRPNWRPAIARAADRCVGSPVSVKSERVGPVVGAGAGQSTSILAAEVPRRTAV
jgi:uncharacterized protein YbjT (DUF2867 family)